MVAPPDHLPALRAFADRAEAVTVEFENVSAPALRWLARRRPVRPGWRTVWVSQNRIREKSFLTRHRIPHAPWHPVRTGDDLEAAVEAVGLPLILKTAASGYDGKGQVRVERAEDADRRLVEPGARGLRRGRLGRLRRPRSRSSSRVAGTARR